MFSLMAVLAWWKEIVAVVGATIGYIYITNLKDRKNYLEAREAERNILDTIKSKFKAVEDAAQKQKDDINKSDDLNLFNKP